MSVNPSVNFIKKNSERVLVISDNRELSLFVQHELRSIQFNRAVSVDFRYSSSNSDPGPLIEMGATAIDTKDESTADWILSSYDIVLSLHCKQIFPRRLVEGICCVNFHPGLNPFNRGWYPQAFSIINGLPIGATIHLMDAEIDHGSIIAQQRVCINSSDTSLDVYEKVIQAEKGLIHDHLKSIIDGRFEISAPAFEGNYNSISDYKTICKLNLKDMGSLQEHINLLRATTHGSFKNAYYIDDDGSRYFVRILIEKG